ncbi:MAG: hypothetical protein OQK12_16265, partial [Motiliproteus sp.]|nr:hypothetical protein [Motiliproteus sp.]
SDPFELEQLIVHQQRLNSRRMMSELASALAENTDIKVNSDELMTSLDVLPITDSRLLQLSASGGDPERLVTYLNYWTQLYLSQFNIVKIEDNQSEIEALQQRLSSVENKVLQKRKDLDQFKTKHSIVSAEREENRSLAKIQALNKALDNTLEEHAKAAALLDSLKTALAAGKEVVRPEDQATISKLNQDVVAHQEEYRSKAEIFTPTYMSMDPDMRALGNKIVVLEEKITTLRDRSRTLYFEDAERDLAAARNQKRRLERELRDHRAAAQAFSSSLDRFNAMRSELEELESSAQALRSRLVDEQVNQPYETKVELLEPPFVASRPIHPDYIQDSIYSVAGGFAFACLSLLIYGFLNPRHRPDIVLNAPTNATSNAQELPYVPGQILPPAESYRHTIAHQTPRSFPSELKCLSSDQCEQLLNAADSKTRTTIALLLSGVEIGELLGLKSGNIVNGIDKLTLMLDERSLVLAPRASAILAEHLSIADESVIYLLDNGSGEVMDLSTLDRYIADAARAAQFRDPGGVSAQLLEHTYRLFLIKQGICLAELERYVGRLTDDVIQKYHSYQTLFDQDSNIDVDPFYPALKT